MASKRPENSGPPELFYNEKEARKYTCNSRIIDIQVSLAERTLELLGMTDEEPKFLLDIGCGSGLSGDVISQAGHYWVGFDISKAMLDVAKEREVEGDTILHDAGQTLPFRPGCFDGCISVSALQWLCTSNKKTDNPVKRLYTFFSSLYACITRGSKAVFQFYPENPQQMELVTTQALRAGFTGGIVVDYPNSSKAKKIFLCLFTGGNTTSLPQGLGLGSNISLSNQISFSHKREHLNKPQWGKGPKKSKEWIEAKKARRRKQGKDTRHDSKYSGRKRRPQF
ncbi:probable 18S rRNA (guanine-N(7))-methyltransferase [Xenia sp. Carnegie-2017]|uniref:probable 18S rRNA (guanine-N(7))-methyltransferase n=1 Tax=Xenia sp. Carnegie-2017 TaxID=2897299 RepID=UPI001F04E1DF|nr:probable 18S rRNA (guanine-N(7))-methyltransferase [Xenia sp. Carnegie-2017]